MVRLVKGAYWDTEIKAAQVAGLRRLSGVHPQGRDRRLLSRLRQARCSPASDAIYPAFATHNANTIGAIKALAGKTRVRIPAPARHGRGALRGAGQARGGDRRPAHAGADLRAGRQPQGIARLSRPPPARERRQFLFVNRIADEDVPLDELVRDPVADLEALEPKRNPAIPLPDDDLRRSAPQQRRRRPQRPAGARAVAGAAASAREPQLDAPSPTRRRRARAGRSSRPIDHRIIVGDVVRSDAPPRSTAMVRAGHAAQPAWDALGGEARAQLLERAADLYEAACAKSSSRCASARPARPWSTRCSKCARRSISCASTPPRRAASSPGRCRCPARPASRTSCACTAAGCSPASRPWNFPLAIFTGLVVGAAGRGQCRHRQAGRADAADRRARRSS